MPELEPITREEKLLDGQDLEPITRKEMFIKRIYDKTQVVPKPITREEMFLNKAGEGGGGDITVEQLNVTENGTYSESGKAYSPVVVEVPVPTLTTLEVDENGTYTAPSGTAYNEVEVDVPLPENAYLLNDLSNLPADIASFTDGTDLPMASLKVAVTPYQDLHGYDAPWAGGAGKNKCNAQNPIVLSQAGNIGEQPCVISADTYTFSWTSSASTAISLTLWNGSTQIGTFASPTSIQGRGSLTFTITENATYLKCYFNGATTVSDIQVEKGSTVSSFAPYSNICPIIGWDEAVVSVSGINVWDEEWESGKYSLDNGSKINDASTIRSKNYINVKPNTTFYSKISSLSSSGAIAFWYDKDKIFIRWEYCGNKSLTVPTNAYYMTFYCGSSYGTTYNYDISINYPSTDTSYHAYNGATYTIDLNGTRYGGTLDATDGTFLDMIDHIASYNGEELPPAWISDRDVYAVGTTPTIGAEVVYPRATPITVQLARTAVKSNEGVNNINANCGQITEVKYFKKA